MNSKSKNPNHDLVLLRKAAEDIKKINSRWMPVQPELILGLLDEREALLHALKVVSVAGQLLEKAAQIAMKENREMRRTMRFLQVFGVIPNGDRTV